MQRLWVPGRLPGLNEMIAGARGSGKGTGFAWQREKKDWEYKIGLLARIQGMKPFGPSYFSWLFVEPNRKRDPSNVSAGAMKVIEDALQKAGVLDNDGWQHVRGIQLRFDVSLSEPGVLLVVHEELEQMSQAIDWDSNLKTAKAAIRGANTTSTGADRGVGLGADAAARGVQGQAEGGARGAEAERGVRAFPQVRARRSAS